MMLRHPNQPRTCVPHWRLVTTDGGGLTSKAAAKPERVRWGAGVPATEAFYIPDGSGSSTSCSFRICKSSTDCWPPAVADSGIDQHDSGRRWYRNLNGSAWMGTLVKLAESVPRATLATRLVPPSRRFLFDGCFVATQRWIDGFNNKG